MPKMIKNIFNKKIRVLLNSSERQILKLNNKT